MITYIIRRVLAMIPALLGISLITFTLMHMTRGGPFSNEHSTPQVLAALMRAYRLDDPIWPTFYGDGAAVWQTVVGGLGILGLLGGLGLLWWRRRPADDLLVADPNVRSPLVSTGQLAGLGILVGGILVIWWIAMTGQGPAANLTGVGFAPGQFLRFLWNALHLDLGPSFSQQPRTVMQIIVEAVPNSFVLGITAFAMLVGMAIPIGVIAAVKQNTWIDVLASIFSLIGYSIPNFVLGILLILITGLWLNILPIAHWGDPIDVVLPAFVLAIRPMAVLTRLTRASMLEVLNQDYIRTAWAKGLSGRVVLIRHALRNGLLPVVTVMGDQLSDLVTGSLVIETLFNIPGIGQWFVQSINARDYGMIMGTTVFYAVLVLLINLVVDLLYGVIDPRVRLGAAARS